MDPSEEIIDEYFEYLADRDVYRSVLNFRFEKIVSRLIFHDHHMKIIFLNQGSPDCPLKNEPSKAFEQKFPKIPTLKITINNKEK